MIKVEIIKKNSIVNSINVLGHANYDNLGMDIVCSSVSTLVLSTIRAIVKFNDNSIKYTINEGDVSIKVINNDNSTTILISNFIEIIKELEKDYKKYINVHEKEV